MAGDSYFKIGEAVTSPPFIPPLPRLRWFDFAHHPELVEGRDFQLARERGRKNVGEGLVPSQKRAGTSPAPTRSIQECEERNDRRCMCTGGEVGELL